MSSEAAVFFSDAHLGAEPKAREAFREARLHEFLDTVAARAAAVYVVGDLFDFWFEYRTAIPSRPFQTLCALGRLRRAGIPVTYLGGNHDFWIGRFLRDELGIEVREGALELELQGRRLWVHHGDGLIGGDLGYKVLKRVLRHPACIALYRLIHPDVGIPLAGWVSGTSRHSRDARPLDGPRLVREVAAPQFARGRDAVIIGHFHHVYEHREHGRDFLVLGDWIRHFTYAVLDGGVLRLERWDGARAEAGSAGTPGGLRTAR